MLILDCDYHVGNDTDDILGHFIEDPTVRIGHLSLGRKYRARYQAEEYLAEIARVSTQIRGGKYAAVLYQAGMDVLVGDPLGGILTYEETYRRDLQVFESCRSAAVPIAWNLAGGYQRDSDGTVMPVLRGHLNTLTGCARVFDGWDGSPDLD